MCDPDESNYHYLPILLFFVFTDWQKYIALYIPFKPPSPRERERESESGKAQNDTNGPF